jgi:hypothetical protein
VVLAPKYSILGEFERGALIQLFPSIRSDEDRFYRFFLYQKAHKAGLSKHQRLATFLQTLDPAEFGS